MPQLWVFNMAGERVGQIEVPAEIFGMPLNRDLLHQAVRVIEDQRTRHAGRAKSRGEVDLTGAKMYRQKGLGRARHGDRGAPQFVGGGVAHPPRGDRRELVMPKRARRQALFMALSERARRGRVLVLEALAFSAPRTKEAVRLLSAMRVEGKVLLLGSRAEVKDENNAKSVRNLPDLVLRESPHLNARDVLWADYLIFTQAALQALEALAGLTPALAGGGEADA